MLTLRLKYMPELDGLRGIAILSVMAFHANVKFLKGGFIGVDIFFVLSGFLITSILVSEYDRYGFVNLKNFYIRRLLRLAPALILMLIVFCVASFFFSSSQKANSNYIDSIISFFYLSNWARALLLHPPDFLGHTWSLANEEQFYIIWPILLVTMLRNLETRKSVFLATILIALLSWAFRSYLHMNGATPGRLYNALDTRADALMVGCALGVAYTSGLFKKPNNWGIISKLFSFVAPISFSILIAFSIYARWSAPHMYHFSFFAIEILAAAIVIDVLIINGGVVKRILATRFLVWVGSISYGLYLWHFPIYKAMFALELSDFTVVTIGSIITFLVAGLSYYLMEIPILKLKKNFSHKTQDNTIKQTVTLLRSA